MVSQLRTDTLDDSRGRILRAAEEEFAARGFDGAKVDRIARRARVNKAMLYYHFGSKLALYRAILTTLFTGMAAAVDAGRRQGGQPVDQVRRFVRAVAGAAATRPHFPAIWLREMAEGGRHLTPAVVGHLGTIVGTLAASLAEGERRRQFRRVNPFVVQMGIVAPLLLFTVSAPIRRRFRHALPAPVADVTRTALVDHVEAMTLAGLDRTQARTPRTASRRTRP